VGAHVQVRTRVHRRPVPDYVIVDELQVERESVRPAAEGEQRNACGHDEGPSFVEICLHTKHSCHSFF